MAESAFDLPRDELIDLFQTGEIEVEGRMPNSSNATLLVTVSDGDRSHKATSRLFRSGGKSHSGRSPRPGL